MKKPKPGGRAAVVGPAPLGPAEALAAAVAVANALSSAAASLGPVVLGPLLPWLRDPANAPAFSGALQAALAAGSPPLAISGRA